jgi:phage baseplate assembly protein W
MAIIFYKDLSLDFVPHPVSGDLRPITNEIAIKRSLKNLILTPRGSKPFKPLYGSDIKNYLFRNADAFTKHDLEKNIAETIALHELRVTVNKVTVVFEDYGIDINVNYFIKNVGGTDNLTVTLKRTA